MNPGLLLNELAREYPDKTILVYKDEEINFLTLNRLANCLAHVLLDIGMAQGKKIGILVPNSIEFVVAYLAVSKTGGVAILLETRLKAKEIKEILDYSDASFVIKLKGIEFSNSKRLSVISIKKGHIYIGCDIISPPESDLGLDLPEESEAAYFHTSGSTGKRKLVVLTHKNISCFPKIMDEFFGACPNSVYGMLLPMSHISGPIAIQGMMENKSRLVIFDQIRGSSILRDIEKHKVTLMWGVPPIYRLIARAGRKQEFDTGSLKVIAVMGMEVPISLIEDLTECFSSAAVIQGYGLTETTGLVTVTPITKARDLMASIGKPVSIVDIKIINDKGDELQIDEAGEIIIKGPMVMKGYYKNEAETQKCIKEDWLYTNDIGYFDGQGFLYYLGRKDDMIITGGFNVFPSEVEDVIRRHPMVKDVAVIGVDEQLRGKVIEAVIVPDSAPSKEEIFSFCRENLPNYKWPRIISFVSELPKTGTSKISRSVLRRNNH